MQNKSEEKINKFMKKYEALTKECGVDIVSFPVWIPDGNGGFKMTIQAQPIDLDEQKKQQLDKAFVSH